MRVLPVGLLLLLASPSWVHAGLEPPVLRLSMESEPTTLDWQKARGALDRFIVTFLMRGLLRYDAQATPVCDLCTEFTTSPDGLKLRFKLKDVEWSDGIKLDAQHFVDAFKRIDLSEDLRAIQSTRADGPGVFEITLSRPLATLPHFLTTTESFPIRKDYLKKSADSGEEHAQSAVLGPYQLAAWERGRRIVIEGNPKFVGERPVYRVEFIEGTHAQQVGRFKAGKIEILSNPTTEDLTQAPGTRLQVNPFWATRSLRLNTRGKAKDIDLRRALLYSLDRQQLPSVLKNGERAATGLIPPGLTGHRNLALVTGDLARAQQERQRIAPADKDIELELLCRDTETDRKVAQWLAEQFGKIKVKLKVRAQAPRAYVRDLEAGKYDLALQTWAFEVANPVDLLRSFKTGSKLNTGGWTSVVFDEYLGRLTSEQKAAEFAGWVDKATQVLESQDVAVIPLGYPTQPFLLGSRVVNFATTPFGDPDLVKIELKR